MGDPVFLHYDRAALDREYDNRAKVAGSAEVLAWYARESGSARSALPCRLDVAYGSRPGEILDVFLPASASKAAAPVEIFIHGGYWQRLDKSDFSYVARAFQPTAAVVVINYALMPTVGMDELVRQCRASAAWVYRNAATFGGDPDRIFVSGHSAGGHLVAMLLATDWPRFEPGLPAGMVKGGCAISGLYDLEPIRLCSLNDVLALTPDVARRNSPIHLVPPEPRPLLVAVGEREGSEYHRQVDALATPWRKHGVTCEAMDMAGHDHFSIMVGLGDPTAELSRAIQRQMAPA